MAVRGRMSLDREEHVVGCRSHARPIVVLKIGRRNVQIGYSYALTPTPRRIACNTGMSSWMSLVSWTLPGGPATGEDQEIWSSAYWRRSIARLRATQTGVDD